MATIITTVTGRAKLKPRREPYWLRIAKGDYLGFRKASPDKPGTWVARSHDDVTGKQRYKALGSLDDLDFDAASAEARRWFEHLGRGGTTEIVTVKVACERYVKFVRDDKRASTADDLQARYKRWIDDASIGRIALDKLTTEHVAAWRATLTKTAVRVNYDDENPVTRERSASSVNRDCTALRAALNHALDHGWATTDRAWRKTLRPTKNADRRRTVYLDLEQRRALIQEAPADVATLLRGMSLLPLRPGALAALTVGDFDRRLMTLCIGKDKSGEARRIKVPEATAKMLIELSKDKLPAAPLFRRADGLAWDKDSWKKPIKAAAAAAKLPEATTAYALRHSVITDLVHGGLDLLTVAQLSGTSVAMIERHYKHLRDNVAAAALARLAL